MKDKKRGRVKRNKRNSQSGMALLMTVLVTAILTTVVVEYNYEANLNVDIAENYVNKLKAGYLAESGVQLTRAYLDSDAEEFLSGEALNIDKIFSGLPIPLGEGVLSVNLESEEGKINVNKLLASAKVQKNFLNLLENLDIDYEVYYTILDWLDEDDDEREDGGAESYYYESLASPYACKNGELESLEELRLIKGVTYEVYNELKDNITIYSNGLININKASRMVLLSLSEDMTEYDVNRIISEREEEEYSDINELSYLGDIFKEIKGDITVEKGNYKITSLGEVHGISYKVTSYVASEKSGTRLLYSKEE